MNLKEWDNLPKWFKVVIWTTEGLVLLGTIIYSFA